MEGEGRGGRVGGEARPRLRTRKPRDPWRGARNLRRDMVACVRVMGGV
jgi:hypothetical protein